LALPDKWEEQKLMDMLWFFRFVVIIKARGGYPASCFITA
jgi:hypothetical protein